jgi:hypothetical protein
MLLPPTFPRSALLIENAEADAIRVATTASFMVDDIVYGQDEYGGKECKMKRQKKARIVRSD